MFGRADQDGDLSSLWVDLQGSDDLILEKIEGRTVGVIIGIFHLEELRKQRFFLRFFLR